MSEANTGSVVELPVGEVGPGPLVRTQRLDLDHVNVLAPNLDDVPPILVRQTGTGWSLIDGHHRLAAAQRTERKAIRAVVVALDDDEALEAAIEANVTHGLPLSASERKAAAKRLIASTKFADRRIAEICGIDHRTVAALRPASHPTGENAPVGRSVGGDGKARPASKAEAKAQRERIRQMLTDHPDLSLTEVARRVGCSPMTAAKVRESMAATPSPAGDTSTMVDTDDASTDVDTEPARPALAAVPSPSSDTTVAEILDPCPVPGQWQKDKRMLATNATRATAQLLDRRLIHTEENEPALVAQGVPAELRSAAAREARDAAAFWLALADALTTTAIKGVQ